MVIATAGVDRLIRYFGIRPRDQGPMAIIAGHDLLVRKNGLKPHILATSFLARATCG